MHVLGHMRGVAAYINMGAALNPVEQFAGLFEQFVLYINLVGLIPRESQIQAMQAAVLEGLLPFGLVQKVRGEMRVAKEQPVTSAGLCGAAFLNKGAKWCNTGARSDHNDVARAVGRQAEPLILFHENQQDRTGVV